MKKTVLAIVLMVFYVVLSGCNAQNTVPANSPIEGPYTSNHEQDFANAVPVNIDGSILQTCYEYADALGYGIKDKANYRAVLLGKSTIEYVLLDDEAKSGMLDENDCLINFDEIRVVVDADTRVVLGRIPYV